MGDVDVDLNDFVAGLGWVSGKEGRGRGRGVQSWGGEGEGSDMRHCDLMRRCGTVGCWVCAGRWGRDVWCSYWRVWVCKSMFERVLVFGNVRGVGEWGIEGDVPSKR